MKKHYLVVEWYSGPVSLYQVEAPETESPGGVIDWLADYLIKNNDFNQERDNITILGGPDEMTKLRMKD